MLRGLNDHILYNDGKNNGKCRSDSNDTAGNTWQTTSNIY